MHIKIKRKDDKFYNWIIYQKYMTQWQISNIIPEQSGETTERTDKALAPSVISNR